VFSAVLVTFVSPVTLRDHAFWSNQSFFHFLELGFMVVTLLSSFWKLGFAVVIHLSLDHHLAHWILPTISSLDNQAFLAPLIPDLSILLFCDCVAIC
jgi:hypothetical protein